MKKDLVEILSIFDKNKTVEEILNVLEENIRISSKLLDKPELVDLGLPSGNLWMTHNLGATSETDSGNYYQFGSLVGYSGEEAEKHSTWNTCPFNDGKEEFDEGYLLKNSSNWFDRDNNLKPEYDAVTQTYGGNYKIPTKEDFKELLDNTTQKFIKDYKNSGKCGKLFTSKINGKTLFFPYSGRVWDSRFRGVGSSCQLWSSRLDFEGYPAYAYSLYCSNGEGFYPSHSYNSLTIRGIKVKGN